MTKPAIASSRQSVLHEGDLIDDRELNGVDRDRLDHERVAHELVDLVTTVETPTNVALYGPWGSGKSGVANLIRAEIEGPQNKKTYEGVKFARFDAFKYADIPLRRNFVHAVADALRIKDDKYGKDLYAGKTTTNIDVPDREKTEIAVWFIGLSMALIAALLGVVALLSLIQPGDWRDDFSNNFSAALPAGLISPVLLAAVFTLVGKTLTIDRSIERPDSVEQFEALFNDLVQASGAKRLVIFVDELDRCSAKEVVATLDAIRTFLGVNKCVFVVAADQQVLEQALSEEARQETPSDAVNPYYSTGSAYLDKVFQYQVSLPPLLPQSVTEFAIKVVEGKGGLWEELDPVDYVVSVLIPSHVTSPRRVKHLLNTFALTYRLAQSKYNAGRLQQDPYTSAQAIARLVCLRVEFPNFARDLTLDPNMPAHVLALLDDRKTDLGPRVAAHVRDRALAYATGEASPARLLSNPDSDDDLENDKMTQGNGGDTEENVAERSTTSNDTDDTSGDAARGPSESGTRAQQGRQLHTYLTRTRLVDGPSRDLIYLHSVGSVYGVSDDIASDLVSALENGQFDDTERIYRDADDESRPRIVQFIAGQIPATFGIERLNAAHALLDLAQRHVLPNLDQVADTAGQAIAEMHRSNEPVLTDGSTPGAWTLASKGTGDGSTTLKRTVLNHLDRQTDWEATYLFDFPVLALDADPGPASRVMAREASSERAGEAVNAIKQLEPATAKRVLAAIGTETGDHLRQLFEQQAAYEAAVKEVEKATAAGTADPDATTLEDPRLPFKEVVRALEDLAEHWAEDHPGVAWLAANILMLGDHLDARSAVERVLPKLGETGDHSYASQLLKAVRRRTPKAWATWLRAISTSSVSGDDEALLNSTAETLLRYATNPDEVANDEDFRSAIEQMVRLTENLPADAVDLTGRATALLDTPVTTEDEASRRTWLLNRLRLFTAPGFVNSSILASHEINNMQQTLEQPLAEQPESSELSTYFAIHGPALASELADPDEAQGASLLTLAQEVRGTAALTERLRTQVTVAILANAAPSLHEQAVAQSPTLEELITFTSSHGRPAAGTITDWVRLANPDRAATIRILDTARQVDVLTEDVARACSDNVRAWSESERLALIKHYIADPNQEAPSALLLAINYHGADASDITKTLVQRFQASGNNTAKETTTSLWAQAGLGDAQAVVLYTDILIPWLQTNTGDSTNADAARRALQTARDLAVTIPTDLRETFADVVSQATEGDNDLTKTAIPTLETLGYSAERVGFFRKRLEVHDDHKHEGP